MVKVYTWHYRAAADKGKDIVLVQTSNTAPSWCRVDYNASILAPPPWLVWGGKYEFGTKEWKEAYYRHLRKNRDAVERVLLEVAATANKGNGAIALLCWEKDSRECHRSLLLNWLRENNIGGGSLDFVGEVGDDDGMYQQLRLPI